MPLASVECGLLKMSEYGEPVDTEFAVWLRKYVEDQRYAAVLIDPLSRFGGRDAESNNSAATRAIQIFESIAATGATVIVAHHTPQWDRREKNPSTSSARGVTGLTDGARWMMHLGVERVAGLDPHLAEIVTASIVKSNYARKGEPVELRRDLDHGGALVPLDDDDREAVKAARGGGQARQARKAEQAAERERRETERATKVAKARAAKQAAKQQEADDDDVAVRQLLASENPPARLRDAVRVARKCGSCGAQVRFVWRASAVRIGRSKQSTECRGFNDVALRCLALSPPRDSESTRSRCLGLWPSRPRGMGTFVSPPAEATRPLLALDVFTRVRAGWGSVMRPSWRSRYMHRAISVLTNTLASVTVTMARDAECKARREARKVKCGAWARSRSRPCIAPRWRRSDGSIASRCRMHGGASTGPKTPEGKARALANLKQFKTRSEPR